MKIKFIDVNIANQKQNRRDKMLKHRKENLNANELEEYRKYVTLINIIFSIIKGEIYVWKYKKE